MNSNLSPSIFDELEEVKIFSNKYFEDVEEKIISSEKILEYQRDYFKDLPIFLQEDAEIIAGRLAKLAQKVAPIIRRSPMLTETDQREAGLSFKGMRAAVRLRRFTYLEADVLHDEGTVLGIQHAREREENVEPSKAKDNFQKCMDNLVNRLELADIYQNESDTSSPLGQRTLPTGYQPNTAFIMMWISDEQPELEDVSSKIKECFRKFGITAVRANDIEHDEIITQKIIDAIKTSEFLIADITGERPSVYYEIGYAHAIGRRVMLYRKSGTRIHFDIQAYNCPEYKNLSNLDNLLTKRLETLTNRLPNSYP